jgi:hypothetical protein
MLKLNGIKPRISFNLVPILRPLLFKGVLTILVKILKYFNQNILLIALFLSKYTYQNQFYAKKIGPIFYLYVDFALHSGDRSNHTI